MMNKFPKNFLIVDEDNPLRREMIETLVEENLDFELSVFTSKNRLEAFEIIENQAIDFIILARLTTQQETIDLMEELRHTERTKETPILLTSSFYSSPTLDEISAQFAKTKYIVRPMQKEAFLESIQALLPDIPPYPSQHR